jgi:hypothetical protein
MPLIRAPALSAWLRIVASTWSNSGIVIKPRPTAD